MAIKRLFVFGSPKEKIGDKDSAPRTKDCGKALKQRFARNMTAAIQRYSGVKAAFAWRLRRVTQ
jgi:hypothetical protein